jgi:hypothetical protein
MPIKLWILIIKIVVLAQTIHTSTATTTTSTQVTVTSRIAKIVEIYVGEVAFRRWKHPVVQVEVRRWIWRIVETGEVARGGEGVYSSTQILDTRILLLCQAL